jgi:hypothetical protein
MFVAMQQFLAVSLFPGTLMQTYAQGWRSPSQQETKGERTETRF